MDRLAACLTAATAFFLASCGQPARDPEDGPLVLAAASMAEALEAAADGWEAQGHPRPVLSFAATSALARQVEAGAEGDLFVSADTKWMDELTQAGLIDPATTAILAGNSLVLVVPQDQATQPVEIGPDFPLLAQLGDGRLAMADPDAVPAGRYGKQALQSLGLWDALADRIVVGENVRVALTLVSRGEAPLGIVYATDAKADPGVSQSGVFPQASHDPMVYPIARLSTSSHPDADAFEQYLFSEEGRAILQGFGFTPG
jgi:molybdate transport system substrate-binding protein